MKLTQKLWPLILLTILTVAAQGGLAEPTLQPLKPNLTIPATAPKIVMERATLEIREGILFYKIKPARLKTELINNLTKDFKLTLKANPKTLTNVRSQPKIYIEPDQEFTRLLVNEAQGSLELLPKIEALDKTEVKLLPNQAALELASKKLAALQLIPSDASSVTPKQVVMLSKTRIDQNKESVSQDLLQTVVFERTINKIPVLDPGSNLTLDLGNQGQVVGLSRNWNQLLPTTLKAKLRSQTDIYDEIESTLKQRFVGAAEVRVDQPRLIYYGENRKYVQPAYFYSAEVISRNNAVNNIYYAGVVQAAANSPEPFTFQKREKEPALPATVQSSFKMPPLGGVAYADGSGPTVGRYVVRDDSSDWVGDACDFKEGLEDGHRSGLPPISFKDYYWDYPWLWTTNESSFVDKWSLVLMEGHGNHWLFTTKSNCCDVVDLNSSSQPGYGDLAGGGMRYLILKGCSIIPAPPDKSNWPDPWWRVFKGLRQAVGFRTSMYINDDIADHFGYHLGENCRVLDSWFHATNGCFSYQWNRFWGASVKGYGSVVMIPGHEGDGIYHLGAAPPATSTGLTIWWQH